MSPKELKKLAKTCRDLGITHYKGPDFEFSLSDHPPVKPSRKAAQPTEVQGEVESDGLSEQELLYWSVSSPFQESANE